eukprot:6014800-Alexandrium_andersonii.AAC.1
MMVKPFATSSAAARARSVSASAVDATTALPSGFSPSPKAFCASLRGTNWPRPHRAPSTRHLRM